MKKLREKTTTELLSDIKISNILAADQPEAETVKCPSCGCKLLEYDIEIEEILSALVVIQCTLCGWTWFK